MEIAKSHPVGVSDSNETEESKPLRGGALLFRNRADRTMLLKDKID